MAKEFVRFKNRGSFAAVIKALPREQQAAWNSLLESVVFRNELEDYVSGGSDLIDHGTTLGLTDDDHAQYHNDARADTWFTTKDVADLAGKSHTDLTDIGSNTHAQVDTHIADSTIHFIESSIDHLNIQNIGTNSHAAIDTHIAHNTGHPNSVVSEDEPASSTLAANEGLFWYESL